METIPPSFAAQSPPPFTGGRHKFGAGCAAPPLLAQGRLKSGGDNSSATIAALDRATSLYGGSLFRLCKFLQIRLQILYRIDVGFILG